MKGAGFSKFPLVARLHIVVILAVAALLLSPAVSLAQDDDIGPLGAEPTVDAKGSESHGIPRFCEEATATSVASGNWSNAATWSTRKVPAAGDAVLIKTGTTVTYDAVSDAALMCVDVEGGLTFRTDGNTRMKVGTLSVLPGGRLEIGTEAAPIAATARAEIVIADQDIDPLDDVEQFGTGIIGLGVIRMHGAIKSPTFIRLAAEPLAGQSTLKLEQAAGGWNAGDRLVIPDTRQLRQSERGLAFKPQWEELTIRSIAADTITLTAPLKFNHRGARDGAGVLDMLPHVANLARNVIVRSEHPQGTRGHVIFNGHADVDIRYALFKDLGRTRLGDLDSVEYDTAGIPRNFGMNQVDRYALNFDHLSGPGMPQPNGYQFTAIGNAIDGALKWGVAVHDSHYGFVADNVVYNAAGAAIVTVEGNESFNTFEHNFAIRAAGSGEFAPRSAYVAAARDLGGEGAAFWLRGPNNTLRRNVAADADVFGFAIATGALGSIRVPKANGSNTTSEGEFTSVEANELPLLEFSGNEAYGAMQSGVAIGWNGTMTDTRVWHASRHAITMMPVSQVTVDGLVARGDPAVLNNADETPTGVWFYNYASKTVTVRKANIQGMRVGVSSPFFHNGNTELGKGDGIVTIEDSYFRNYVGIAVATTYAPPDGTRSPKRAVVRNSRFETLKGVPAGQYPPAAISMNYGMAPGDDERREPVVVYDFNSAPGDTFRVFYSLDLPASAAPCAETHEAIGGFVCSGDGSGR